MKLKVEHTTVFEYDTPVYETATEVRLTPVSQSGAGQRCLDYRLQLAPTAPIFRYSDCFGNLVEHFNMLSTHDRLEITAISLVETGLPRGIDREDSVRLQDFLLPSRYVALGQEIADFAKPFENGRDDAQTAYDVARAIYKGFVYVPGVTGVNSTTVEVMKLRQGVCQDFAHVMIATCRALGLPARYVSGYYYGAEETDSSDRASHAWCEVYCGPDFGWRAYDPTHDNIFPDERYITIGTGRDYDDVPPIRGTFKGVAGERLKVSVAITDVGRATATGN